MARVRVFCDFNAGVAEGAYSLSCQGTRADLARAQVTLRPGLELELYDHDEADDGTPVLMLADAIVVDHPVWGLVAKTTSPFRWTPEDAAGETTR